MNNIVSTDQREGVRTLIPLVRFDVGSFHDPVRRSYRSKDFLDSTSSVQTDTTLSTACLGTSFNIDDGFSSWMGFHYSVVVSCDDNGYGENASEVSSIDGMTMNSETLGRSFSTTRNEENEKKAQQQEETIEVGSNLRGDNEATIDKKGYWESYLDEDDDILHRIIVCYVEDESSVCSSIILDDEDLDSINSQQSSLRSSPLSDRKLTDILDFVSITNE